MISSHYDQHADGKDVHHPPPCRDGSQDSRCQTVVMQQGSGPNPYGLPPGTTVVLQHGRPDSCIKGTGCVALGALFLVASFVLLFIGIIRVAEHFGGIGKNLHEQHRDSWNFEQRSNFFLTPALFGFGVITLCAGLSCCIPSMRHEMKKYEQSHRPRTGDQALTGSDQLRLNPPRQPYYHPSHQPSYQQGSNIPLQPFQPNSSYPLGSAIPPPHFQSNPSYQESSTFPRQPFQPIPPSTNPPSYTTEPVLYPKAGFTSSADPEMGYTKANWVL